MLQYKITYLRFLLQRNSPITRVVIKVTSKTRGTMIAILPKTGKGNIIE